MSGSFTRVHILDVRVMFSAVFVRSVVYFSLTFCDSCFPTPAYFHYYFALCQLVKAGFVFVNN